MQAILSATITPRDACQLLKAAGFRRDRTAGSHAIFEHPCGVSVVVPVTQRTSISREVRAALKRALVAVETRLAVAA